MRKNEPVTGQEHALAPGMILLTVTDPEGRIVFCNQQFVQASGFELGELLGQPHNIMRHPDMPEAAFGDMWAALKARHHWRGLVKNRRKDGSHYWVRAHVTPMYDGDRVTGYLSVRTPVPGHEVQTVSRLYAQLRQQEQGLARRRLMVSKGRVVPAGWRGALLGLWQSHPLLRLGLMVGVATAITLGAAWRLPAPAAALVALADATVLLALLHARVVAPLQRVLDDARHLAGGDLTHDMYIKDPGLIGELEGALSQMALNMRAVVVDTRTDIQALSGMVDEIHVGNQHLATRTEDQARNLMQTADWMQAIATSANRSAESAGEGTRMASETQAVAQRSHAAVQAVGGSMDEISASARQIGDISNVVQGLAFQTNILALNAAVEAARAGEAGRGFSVVAAEVRALANRTSAAAREITALIHDSDQRVQAGNAYTGEARGRMDEALASIASVGAVLGEIDAATRTQQGSIHQVNDAVAQLNVVTRQNATMVEELQTATRTMLNQVQAASNAARVFRVQVAELTVAEMDAVALRKAHLQARAGMGDDDAPIDFEQAIAAHGQWKVKLRNAMRNGEQLDAAAIGCDDRCPLGKWIHGPGRARWGNAPDFVRLLQSHATFHRCASEVAQAVNAGRVKEANRMLHMGTPFAQATHEVVDAIRTLAQAGESPAQAPEPAARAATEPAAEMA